MVGKNHLFINFGLNRSRKSFPTWTCWSITPECPTRTTPTNHLRKLTEKSSWRYFRLSLCFTFNLRKKLHPTLKRSSYKLIVYFKHLLLFRYYHTTRWSFNTIFLVYLSKWNQKCEKTETFRSWTPTSAVWWRWLRRFCLSSKRVQTLPTAPTSSTSAPRSAASNSQSRPSPAPHIGFSSKS